MEKHYIYMDNAATSFPKPEEVYLAGNKTLRTVGGSPGRSGHRMSVIADRTVFKTREAVAELLNIKDSSRIVFTSGATQSLNLGIKGFLNPGDHVITSTIEHNSVTRPLYRISRSGIEVSKIGSDPDGFINPDDIKKNIRKNTKLIVLTHASNVIGAIEPVEIIGAIAREKGVAFLLDASQTAGFIPVDVQKINVDMIAMPGHKSLLGPQGVGLLYIGPHIRLEPLIEGGTGGGSSAEKQPDKLPDRFEAGTMNTPAIAGLGAGVRYILERGINNLREKELSLLERLIHGLKKIKGMVIYGPQNINDRVSLVSFNIRGLAPETISFLLDENFGIMTRAGIHCSPDAHKFLNTLPSGSVRLSPGIFNTKEDMDYIIFAINEIAANKCGLN